jgi:hypothetical protein
MLTLFLSRKRVVLALLLLALLALAALAVYGIPGSLHLLSGGPDFMSHYP